MAEERYAGLMVKDSASSLGSSIAVRDEQRKKRQRLKALPRQGAKLDSWRKLRGRSA
jgi:hypothetical protein